MFKNVMVLFKGEYLKTVHFILSNNAANSYILNFQWSCNVTLSRWRVVLYSS